MPDIVLLLRFLLNDTQQQQLRNAFLQTAIANGYHSASAFFVMPPGQNVTRMGVWLGPWLQNPSPVPFDEAKRNGLDRSASSMPFPDRNLWAYSVNKGTIEREVQRVWNLGTIPRHLNSDGAECFLADCDIDIDFVSPYWTDLQTPFTPRPNLMYTFISGKYNPALPDIKFVVAITELFNVENGQVRIDNTIPPTIEKDTSVLNYITAIAAAIAAFYGALWGGWAAVLPLLATGFFGGEDIAVHLANPSMQNKGIGALMYDILFPSRMNFPGLPVNLYYTSVSTLGALVSSTGTFATPVIREGTLALNLNQ